MSVSAHTLIISSRTIPNSKKFSFASSAGVAGWPQATEWTAEVRIAGLDCGKIWNMDF
jgi:hypothetical protein